MIRRSRRLDFRGREGSEEMASRSQGNEMRKVSKAVMRFRAPRLQFGYVA